MALMSLLSFPCSFMQNCLKHSFLLLRVLDSLKGTQVFHNNFTTDIAIAKYMYLINIMVSISFYHTFRKPFSGEIWWISGFSLQYQVFARCPKFSSGTAVNRVETQFVLMWLVFDHNLFVISSTSFSWFLLKI